MRSIYGRQFAMMAGVILFSFLLLGSAFALLSYQYIATDRQESLERTADNVADITATALTQLGDRSLDSAFIRTNLSNLAAMAGSDILLATSEGQVALAVDSEGTIQTALIGSSLPASMVTTVTDTGYAGMTSLNGFYETPHYVVGVPLILTATVNGQEVSYVAGLVFLTSETSVLTNMWREMAQLFVLTAAAVIALTFLLSSFTAVYHSKPLKRIASAARAFGHGEFDVRVNVGDRVDEIGELAEAFNAMADSIAQSEQRRSEFIANVSHELKTPMTTIAGFADGILDGTIPPEQEEKYLQVISSETRRLSRLVRNMLDSSRLREEDDGASHSQFDVCELFLRVLVSLENKITDKNLEVATDLPEEPIPVWGDPDAITQVCYNLLDNAIKFSHPGGTLELSIKTKGAKVLVSVGNQGEPIPAEEIPLIFDRFHKSDRSRSLDRDGVGLGLYIVKSILNSHREDITCTSEEGCTRFTFTLTRA